MASSSQVERLTRLVRIELGLFVVGLVLSGLTAFPLETEVGLLGRAFAIDPLASPQVHTGLKLWIAWVAEGVRETNARYPFMAYGTDWLAFAHLAIALAFIGPWRDPVRNRWVVTWGMLACAAVIPTALIAGEVRSIPFLWRLIDCSFGVVGIVPLALARRHIDQLEALELAARNS